MKKLTSILLGASVLVSFNAISDEPSPEVRENSVAAGLTAGTGGLGGRVVWRVETEDSNGSAATQSEISINPSFVDFGTQQLDGNKFHIDLFGDTEKKRFLVNGKEVLVPYFVGKSSGLEYTYDGAQGSWRMLNSGIGAGLNVNINDDIRINGQAGVGIGVELGKRDGILDTAVFAEAGLDFYDLVNLTGSQELRRSLSGERELINEVNLGVNVSDNIRLGFEVEKSRNVFNSESGYEASYGGVFAEGRIGKLK